jgi:uncharacterized lipoprotein NlpE involved in copper resistance
MKKTITLLLLVTALISCNDKKEKPFAAEVKKDRIDSAYAIYSMGNSIEAFSSKVIIVEKDTTLTVLTQVDSVTQKKRTVDTTLKLYFIPLRDTLFKDQTKRINPVFDSATKQPKATVVWRSIDAKFILQEFKIKK